MTVKKIFAALLAAAVLAPLASCGGEAGTPAPETAAAAQDGASQAGSSQDGAATAETEPDKFAGMDLGGAEIRIQTSVNTDDATNANFLIEGTGAENGDVANDAVYRRNLAVEELLNVKLKYYESDETWRTAQDAVQKIVMSGEDAYDVIIQDLFPMCSLAVEGMFLNVAGQPVMDFSQPYWWGDYMADLSLGKGSAMYILAGDYFMDVLCSAHALYFNKQLLESLTGDPNEIYNKVLDGTWTADEFIKYVESAYQDLNGDSAANEGDCFGYICGGMWGSGIPFYVCGDLKFVTRDESGVPSFTLDEDPRAASTLEMLNRLFYSPAIYIKDDTPFNRAYFSSGNSLFVGYQRVGTFDYFRDTEFDVGILPYPKLDAEQKNYVTSTHDTTEIGVIPITNSRLETTCAVIEALCRETRGTVIPAYYETSLKIKYARDDIASQMLDIIHDNLRVAFPIAYNGYLDGNMLTNTFRTPLEKHSSDFASTIAKVAPEARAKLEKMIETYNDNVG